MQRAAAVIATLIAATAGVILVARPVSSPRPASSPAVAREPLIATGVAAGTTRAAGTVVRAGASETATEISRIGAGILLPVLEDAGEFVRVLTPCELVGWVRIREVRTHPPAAGNPATLDQATVVIDPGHGGLLPGTVGPSGLPEKEPNLDISKRLAKALGAGRVFLTREADHVAGLRYRSEIADALHAHAFLSVHNNAEPDGPFSRPGSETYYQRRSEGSKRLAGLVYEELIEALGRYDADWVADTDAGAKYRMGDDGTDYYALLRTTAVPTTIVESLFVTNPPEERLLRRADVRASIAGAIGRGVKRFIETKDPGSGFTTPYDRPPGPSGRLPERCVEPQ